jgi:hypothetical protein
MRLIFYSALIALALGGAISLERERVQVLMELKNDTR